MKKFERPKEGRVIAGVAAAIANYYNINVIWVRLVWLLLLLPGGFPGVLPYVLLWILIPSEKTEKETSHAATT